MVNIKNNSIILMGPGCVGKTLISEELSILTGYPIISIDDLFSFINLESRGFLSNNKEKIDNYMRLVSDSYDEDFRFALKANENELKSERSAMIKSYVKDYKRYQALLGDLKQFYYVFKAYDYFHDVMDKLSPNVVVWMEKFFCTQMMQIILSKIDQKVIFDMPGYYGFKQKPLTKEEIKSIEKLGFHIVSFDLEQQLLQQIKRSGTSVLLEPGIDYEKRRANDIHSDSANILSNETTNYYPYADMVVSVNGMFYNPEDKSLRSRYYFDVRSVKEREKIKNYSEVKNIAYSILKNVEELSIIY